MTNIDTPPPAPEGSASGATATGSAAADSFGIDTETVVPGGKRARARAVGRSGVAHARRISATVRAVVTPLGAVLAVSAVVGIGFGLWGQWTELVALGICALVLCALAAFFLIGNARYEVELGLAASRVVVGARAVGTIAVRNASARTAVSSVIEVPIGRNIAAFDIPRLAGHATHEDLFTIPTQKRAVHVLGPVRAVRGDPLGMLRREQIWGQAQNLYVHPKTLRLDPVTSGYLRDLDGYPLASLSNDDVAFHALREYNRGDDRRSVHWKSTARTGTLMVRQYEETRRWYLAIGLSTALAEYADEEEFETAVSVSASLGANALTDGRDVTVLTHDRGLHTGSPRMLLDQMSAVQVAPRRKGIIHLANDIAAEAPDASLVVLIVGGCVEVSKLKAAHARIPLGARTIAVRVDRHNPPSRGRIGDLAVLTIATLADLPRALRSVIA